MPLKGVHLFNGAPMRSRRLIVTVVALWSVAAGSARADPIDDFVTDQMNRFRLPGISLVVLKDGKIIKAAGYGFADLERRIPVTPETVFKIGSVSKQFIASGIMLLVQEGRIGIDDPVSKHLDGTPPAWQPITIRHLLTHTAGLVRESPAFNPERTDSDTDLLEAVYPLPLRFAPGAKWEYSNTGYYALAQIITNVSGNAWPQFLRDRVFAPAGMQSTAPTNVAPMLPNRALGYTGNDNQGGVAPDWVALRPSGAFLSTALDLAKWDATLYTTTILGESTRRDMWAPVALSDGTSAPYGFGWHVETWKEFGRSVWHGGGLPGFSAYSVRYLDDKLSVVVLTNGDDADPGGIAVGVARLHKNSQLK
jgi:CubicO group peptidase (beta-lactamase class C family)